MRSTAERLEFAPPRDQASPRAFVLALLVHILLIAALTWGVNWKRTDDAASFEAELWSGAPQQIAPKELVAPPAPTPPPAPPVQVPAPPPPAVVKAPEVKVTPPLPDVDIALEKEKKRKLQQQQNEAQAQKAEKLQDKRDAELQQAKKEKELKAKEDLADRKAEELAQKAEAKKQEAREQAKEKELEKEKEKRTAAASAAAAAEKQKKAAAAVSATAEKQKQATAEKQKIAAAAAAAASAAKQKQVAAAASDKQHQETVKRIMGMAGADSSGAAGSRPGSGSAKAEGPPSAGYAGKVRAKVLPNVMFADEISGNPKAEVEVSTTSDGTIMSQRLVKSSGNKAWDEAAVKAIVRTGSLPRDIDGRIPTPMIIELRPN